MGEFCHRAILPTSHQLIGEAGHLRLFNEDSEPLCRILLMAHPLILKKAKRRSKGKDWKGNAGFLRTLSDNVPRPHRQRQHSIRKIGLPGFGVPLKSRFAFEEIHKQLLKPIRRQPKARDSNPLLIQRIKQPMEPQIMRDINRKRRHIDPLKGAAFDVWQSQEGCFKA